MTGNFPPQASRRAELAAVAVFIVLLAPSLAFSFFTARQSAAAPFVPLAVSTILRDLALVSLIAFFVWRNREPASAIGWNWRNGWEDVFLGIGLFMPVFIVAGILEIALRRVGFTAPNVPLPSLTAIQGPVEIGLAVLLFVVVALAEETIFRGYLILRFASLTGRPAAAAVLSTILFSLGHGYEGSAGVVTVGFIGLVYASVYIWRRSLVAPMVMHFMHNFASLLFILTQKMS